MSAREHREEVDAVDSGITVHQMYFIFREFILLLAFIMFLIFFTQIINRVVTKKGCVWDKESHHSKGRTPARKQQEPNTVEINTSLREDCESQISVRH
eukprot:gene26190-biopygen14769